MKWMSLIFRPAAAWILLPIGWSTAIFQLLLDLRWERAISKQGQHQAMLAWLCLATLPASAGLLGTIAFRTPLRFPPSLMLPQIRRRLTSGHACAATLIAAAAAWLGHATGLRLPAMSVFGVAVYVATQSAAFEQVAMPEWIPSTRLRRRGWPLWLGAGVVYSGWVFGLPLLLLSAAVPVGPELSGLTAVRAALQAHPWALGLAGSAAASLHLRAAYSLEFCRRKAARAMSAPDLKRLPADPAAAVPWGVHRRVVFGSGGWIIALPGKPWLRFAPPATLILLALIGGAVLSRATIDGNQPVLVWGSIAAGFVAIALVPPMDPFHLAVPRQVRWARSRRRSWQQWRFAIALTLAADVAVQLGFILARHRSPDWWMFAPCVVAVVLWIPLQNALILLTSSRSALRPAGAFIAAMMYPVLIGVVAVSFRRTTALSVLSPARIVVWVGIALVATSFQWLRSSALRRHLLDDDIPMAPGQA